MEMLTLNGVLFTMCSAFSVVNSFRLDALVQRKQNLDYYWYYWPVLFTHCLLVVPGMAVLATGRSPCAVHLTLSLVFLHSMCTLQIAINSVEIALNGYQVATGCDHRSVLKIMVIISLLEFLILTLLPIINNSPPAPPIDSHDCTLVEISPVTRFFLIKSAFIQVCALVISVISLVLIVRLLRQTALRTEQQQFAEKFGYRRMLLESLLGIVTSAGLLSHPAFNALLGGVAARLLWIVTGLIPVQIIHFFLFSSHERDA